MKYTKISKASFLRNINNKKIALLASAKCDILDTDIINDVIDNAVIDYCDCTTNKTTVMRQTEKGVSFCELTKIQTVYQKNDIYIVCSHFPEGCYPAWSQCVIYKVMYGKCMV